MIDDQFDVNAAFEFLEAKEGRQKPRKYIKYLLRTGQIDKFKVEDIACDEELFFIYQLIYNPESIKNKDVTLNILNLYEFDNIKNIDVRSLTINSFLMLYGCGISEFPVNTKIGNGGVIFRASDPIPIRFNRSVSDIQKHIESRGGSNKGGVIFCA